jgi:hypothetical protein
MIPEPHTQPRSDYRRAERGSASRMEGVKPSSQRRVGDRAMERVSIWRSSPWARWLGWTLMFGLLFAGVIVAMVFTVPIPNMTGDLILVVFALTLVAAFAIGVRFPSWSWAAGPPAAILITVLAILLFPETDAAQRTARGESTQKEQFVFMLVGGGACSLLLLAVGYALLAAAGVRVGQRREATTDGSARSRLGDDASA